MRGSVSHLFRQFQDSLGVRRESEELPFEAGMLAELLRALLSEESCEEWLGYHDMDAPDSSPPGRWLSGLILESDWTVEENVHKLRLYRAAAFVDCLRPDALDWVTPSIADMEWVQDFVKVFGRPGISLEDQSYLIEDLSRPYVPLKMIGRSTRGPRLKLSSSELRYVWETRDLSHAQRAAVWDNRAPKPFSPFGCSNVEMYDGGKKLRNKWSVAVKRLINKAKAAYGVDLDKNQHQLN